MNATRRYVAFGFGSTHDALVAETALKAAGVAFATVPAPKELGTLCGIALRVEPAEVPAAENAMREAGVDVTGQTDFEDR